MKYIGVLFILFSIACNSVSSQNPSQDMADDKEFYEVLRKAEETRKMNKLMMDSMDKKTTQIVKKTSEQIVTLKQEVKELKKELDETTVKPSNGAKFKLLPIANGTEDKQ